MTKLRRALCPLVSIAVGLTLLGGFAAAPSSAVAAASVRIKLKAPIAVRVSHKFKLRGSVSAPASAGETVTIKFSRKNGKTWSVVTTATATLASSRAFSCMLKTTKRGQWRVSASLPATSTHATATASVRLRAVGRKAIALTFDDGPWPTTTKRIVRALHAGKARATFFMLGSQIGSRRKLARYVTNNGNIIGVHSWGHAVMVNRSSATNKADLARCIRAVRSATGKTPHWFRPPYGSTNSAVRKAAKSKGLRQVIWTVDTLDWRYRSTSSVVSRTLSGARNGAVVLMHDGGGPRGATAAAVPIIVRKLRAKGYDFVTLDEMAALGYKIR